MLTTIHDDTWNVLNMQHIISNSKKNGIIQTSLVADFTSLCETNKQTKYKN